MVNQRTEYRFKIGAYSPETMPMARLAEYMSDLATLLGNRDSVHFVKLDPGSTTLVQDIEYEAVPKIRHRINGVRTRTAPEDAIDAYGRIDKRLQEDNAVGHIETVEDASESVTIIEFPGRERRLAEKFDSISQPGNLDGLLIRVGGKDNTVPIYLEEQEEIHRCTSNRALAKRLSPYLFEIIRVHGVGKWNIDSFGNWVMEEFRISDFERLDTTSLSESVKRLRNIKSNIQAQEDPIAELNKLRHGTEE
jgi:hypothetical protein